MILIGEQTEMLEERNVILDDISRMLQTGKTRAVQALVQKAIEEGFSAREIFEDGLERGMNEVGERFRNKEAFMPELMGAARAMNACTRILAPLLAENEGPAVGLDEEAVQAGLNRHSSSIVQTILDGRGPDESSCDCPRCRRPSGKW